MRAPLLDTHAWVWWIEGDRRLGDDVAKALDELPADERPLVADISLWEVALLVERGRRTFDMPLRLWLETAAHPRSVRVVPILPEIASEVAELPPTFHRDPADRLIVATSRALGVPVLTHDAAMAKSGLVRRWKLSA